MTVRDSASNPLPISKQSPSESGETVGATLNRWMWSWLGLAIALMTSATLGAIAAWVFPPPSKDFVQPEVSWHNGFGYQLSQPIHILLLGVERLPDGPEDSPDEFSGHSDTLLLLRFDPLESSASLLSIPRDTLADLPGFGVSKVNQANYEGGIDLAKETIQSLLNEVPIHRYVRIDTEALKELVDLLGGVEVFIHRPMSYVDRTQQLEIDLDAGWQILNGVQAEQFSRFRQGAYGDVGRVQRQQELLQALRSRLTQPMVLPRLPEVIRVIQKYIDTDLSLSEMMALVNFGLQLEPDELKMVMLPGSFSGSAEYESSYWIVDYQRRDRILEDYFRQPIERGFRVRSPSRDTVRVSPNSLRIALQNTTGDPKAMEYLRASLAQHGFENVYVAEDWPDPQRHTQIIVQKGHLQGANLLQQALRFGKIVAASTGDLDSDLTIRVGEDWQ